MIPNLVMRCGEAMEKPNLRYGWIYIYYIYIIYIYIYIYVIWYADMENLDLMISNASLFRWQVFSSTWGPIYSPVMSSVSMRSLIFQHRCSSVSPMCWRAFPNHPQPRTFSAVSEPPRLKQLDTAMMYLCHQFCSNTDKLGWNFVGQLSCLKPRSIKIMVI